MRATDRSVIGTLNEMSLHAALKTWYQQPGDDVEMLIDGYVIDIVRDDMLVEIQTRNFSAIKQKLSKLTIRHHVHLIHPIPREKWILRVGANGHKQISKRKSPKRGSVEHLFFELVSIPKLAVSPNLSIEVLLTQEEEIWKNDGKGSWRRKRWSISDRRLLNVLESVILTTTCDYQNLLPACLSHEFTTANLMEVMGINYRLAGKMTYCLREMGAIKQIGKQGRAFLYTINHQKDN
jgi:hypothetical protein